MNELDFGYKTLKAGDIVELTETGKGVYGTRMSAGQEIKIISINNFTASCKVGTTIVNISPYYLQLKKEDDKMIYYCNACILKKVCAEKKLHILHLTGTQYFEGNKPSGCEPARQQKAITEVSKIFYRKDRKISAVFSLKSNLEDIKELV
jgi:hypothetical protein